MIGTCDFTLIWRHTSRPDRPGQHEVEQDQVGAVALEDVHRHVAVAGDLDLVALSTEHEGQCLGERLLVLDDHDAGHVSASPEGMLRTSRVSSVPSSPDGLDGWYAGSRSVKVDPTPTSDHTVHSPPWFWLTCLTIARPEAGAAGDSRPCRVDSVEALEHPVEVVRRDADALVLDRDLDDRAVRAHADGDARVPGRVGDRVDEQVAQRGEQLALVAVDEPLAGIARDELDVLAARLRAHLVDRAPHEVVDVDHLGPGQRVVTLQAGQVDDVLDEVAQARGLHLHALGEVAHLVGVVAGGEHGLGQQRQRADRGLELVADVGHEVAPDDVDAALLGEVVDEDEDRPGAERGDADAQLEELPAEGWAPDPHLLLAGVTVVGDPLDQVGDVGDRHGLAVDQAQARRPGVGPQHGSVGGDHEGRRRQHAEHPDDLVRHGRPRPRSTTRARGALGRGRGQASRHPSRIGARHTCCPTTRRPAPRGFTERSAKGTCCSPCASPRVHPGPSAAFPSRPRVTR